ncbi:Hypothetical predicted protein [Paramuricea clavata]|nr:Hypothetical predicted protein [Paramuricea clavata]
MKQPTATIKLNGHVPRRAKLFKIRFPCTRRRTGTAMLRVKMEFMLPAKKRSPVAEFDLNLRRSCENEHKGTPNHYGKHFITGFTAQSNSYRDDYIGLSILAPYDTNVTIFGTLSSKPWNYTVHIKEGESYEYKLPISLRMEKSKYLQNDISVLCLNKQGYRRASDGYLALPTNTLGLVYVVASYQPYSSNYRANIAVISTHNNNTVIVLPKKNAVIYYRGLWYGDSTSLLYITLVLEKLEALYISSSSDLSGTIVIASKPVTVISGVDYARILGSYDFLEAFLLPVSSWGCEYILTTVGAMDKNQGDIFRIFAYENNTVVESAYWTKILSSGAYTELMLQKNLASFVKCSKPCQVAQYIRRHYIGGKYADASMIILPSTNQFLSYYRVVLPRGSEYHDSITMVIQNEDIEGLYMNGLKLNGLRWERINETKYVWTVVSLSDPNTVAVYHTSSAVKFGLVVFGWNNGASYAYSGGFGLDKNANGKVLYLW